MSINLPLVHEARIAARTILSRLLIKDLTRPCFHLLRGVDSVTAKYISLDSSNRRCLHRVVLNSFLELQQCRKNTLTS